MHGFIKGMVAGTVMGIGITMMVNPIDERDKRRISKKASRMFTTLGSMADNMIDIYRN